MINRGDVGSWISGPPAPGGRGYPGEDLGRPESGPGSVARFGRRLLALAIDWAIVIAISAWLFGYNQWANLALFLALNVLLVGTVGSTIGHRLLGLRVERLGGGWAGPLKALIRSLLLALVIPAAIWDRNQRGLHDQAAGTVLVRR